MSVAVEPPAWLWIACTVAAAGFQTARNAMQRSLTDRLGTVGATHVRFLFGLPFGLLFAVALFAASLFLGQSVGVTLAASLAGRIGAGPVIALSGLTMLGLGLWFSGALRRRSLSQP